MVKAVATINNRDGSTRTFKLEIKNFWNFKNLVKNLSYGQDFRSPCGYFSELKARMINTTKALMM